MSKTILEVQKAKKELETKIARLLIEFEIDNGVQVGGCYCDSYDNVINRDGASLTAPYNIIHKIDFSISVRL